MELTTTLIAVIDDTQRTLDRWVHETKMPVSCTDAAGKHDDLLGYHYQLARALAGFPDAMTADVRRYRNLTTGRLLRLACASLAQ
jgi:hypothetical protein